MGKFQKAIISVLLAVVILLFVLSSTDWVLKDAGSGVRKVSVIINNSDTSCWSNFKTGALEVANRNKVEVNFLALNGDANMLEQQEVMIQSEIDQGTQALIIAPVDDASVTSFVKEKARDIPVLLAYSDPKQTDVAAVVTFDARAAGVELAQEIVRRHGSGVPIIFLSGYGERWRIDEAYAGLREGLREEAADLVRYNYASRTRLVEYVKEKRRRQEMVIFVGGDAYTTEQVLKALADEPASWIDIYGIGYTNAVVKAVENGVVRSIEACSDYTVGVQSVQTIISLLEGEKAEKGISLRHVLITKENIFKEQKVLFPIF